MYERKIDYDRETHDYAMYIRTAGGEWELVGFERTYHSAEIVLDQLIFELQAGMYFKEAA